MHHEHSDAMVLVKIQDNAGNVIKMTWKALFKKQKWYVWYMSKHGMYYFNL